MLYVGVGKILPLEGGALSCGGDGSVKLFRLTPVAFDLAGQASADVTVSPGASALF